VTDSSSAPSFVQIAGYIKDAGSKQGMANIRVGVKDGSDNWGYATTNSSGYYAVSNVVSSGEYYAVRIQSAVPANYTSLLTVDSDFDMTKSGAIGWTWMHGLNRDTNVGEGSYEVQKAGLWDCSGPGGTGAINRCNFVYAPVPPAGVSNIKAICNSSGTSVDLSWNSVSRADNYIVRLNKEPYDDWGNNWSEDIWKQVTTNSWTQTIAPDKNYDYSVQSAYGSVRGPQIWIQGNAIRCSSPPPPSGSIGRTSGSDASKVYGFSARWNDTRPSRKVALAKCTGTGAGSECQTVQQGGFDCPTGWTPTGLTGATNGTWCAFNVPANSVNYDWTFYGSNSNIAPGRYVAVVNQELSDSLKCSGNSTCTINGGPTNCGSSWLSCHPSADSVSFTVPAAPTATPTIAAVHTFSGKVAYTGGTGVGGVVIKLYEYTGTAGTTRTYRKETTTSTAGTYSFPSLANGTYDVEPQANAAVTIAKGSEMQTIVVVQSMGNVTVPTFIVIAKATPTPIATNTPTPPLPDLKIEDMSRDTNYFKVKYCNRGAGTSIQKFTVEVKDTASGKTFETNYLYPFAVPAVNTCDWTGGITCGLIGDAGCNKTLSVLATADFRKTVPESNESNNTFTKNFAAVVPTNTPIPTNTPVPTPVDVSMTVDILSPGYISTTSGVTSIVKDKTVKFNLTIPDITGRCGRGNTYLNSFKFQAKASSSSTWIDSTTTYITYTNRANHPYDIFAATEFTTSGEKDVRITCADEGFTRFNTNVLKLNAIAPTNTPVPNQPPSITSLKLLNESGAEITSPNTIPLNSLVNVSLRASDQNITDTLTASIFFTSRPAGCGGAIGSSMSRTSVSPGVWQFSYLGRPSCVGQYLFRVGVDDGTNPTVSRNMSFTTVPLPTATFTQVPPSPTFTQVPPSPTFTPVPPTNTPTAMPPTNTPTQKPTNIPTSVPTFCLGNQVFKDMDNNSIFNSSIDLPFNRIKLTLFKYENNIPVQKATTISNTSGIYAFCNLPQGQYDIKIMSNDQPEGWLPAHKPDGFTINGHLGDVAFDNRSLIERTFCADYCGEMITLTQNTNNYDFGLQQGPSLTPSIAPSTPTNTPIPPAATNTSVPPAASNTPIPTIEPNNCPDYEKGNANCNYVEENGVRTAIIDVNDYVCWYNEYVMEVVVPEGGMIGDCRTSNFDSSDDGKPSILDYVIWQINFIKTHQQDG